MVPMILLSQLPGILAAEWVQIVIGGIVFIFYIVGQLMSLRGEAKAKPKPGRRRPAPAPDIEEQVILLEEEHEVAPRQPVDQAESLRNEIEDFVRRAQGRPPQQSPKPRQRPAHSPQVKRQQVRSQRSPKSEPKQKRPQPEVAPPTLRSEGLAEHVSRHIRPGKVAQHAEQLGSDVGQSDERMESRLHEKFDHTLGNLQQSDAPSEEKRKEDAAAQIADLLSHPEGVRQLILANEILRRPQW